MYKCLQCDSEIKEEDEICPNCGIDLTHNRISFDFKYSKYRRSPTGVGASLDKIGEGLSSLSNSLKTNDTLLLEIENKIKELEKSLSDSRMQRNKAIADEKPQSLIDYYNNEIELTQNNIDFWSKKAKNLERDIDVENEYKAKSKELSYQRIDSKYIDIELANVKNEWYNAFNECFSNKTIKKSITYNTLKRSDIINDFINAIKSDYDTKGYSDMDLKQLYLKALDDVYKIYKQDIKNEIETEKQEVQLAQLRHKQKLAKSAGRWAILKMINDGLNKLK